MGKQWETLFWGAPKSLQMVTAAMKLKDTYSLEGKLQAVIKITGRRINNLKHADDTTPMAGKWRGTKEPLMKVKEESEKAGLKGNIQKTKIMASSSISSWQIDKETMETVRDFIFWAPKSLQMVTEAIH